MEVSFQNIKKGIVEIKIFSILVKSTKGFMLHTGVYFTLEEAYEGARKGLTSTTPHLDTDVVLIEAWNSISLQEAIVQSMEPAASNGVVLTPDNIKTKNYPAELPKELVDMLEAALSKTLKKSQPESQPEPVAITSESLVEDVCAAKSNLMKQMIKDKDVNAIKVNNSVLTTSEKRYIFKEIQKEILSSGKEKESKEKIGSSEI